MADIKSSQSLGQGGSFSQLSNVIPRSYSARNNPEMRAMERSPLAPASFPDLPPIAGVRVAVARAHYKAWDRCDLTLAQFDAGTTVAGVTTKSKCPSPEVEWCRAALPLGTARALVVNAGNSNAFTGSRGRAAVEAITARVAGAIGCRPLDVFVASTGVIGVPLPIDKAEAGIDAVLQAPPANWEEAAATIMTTDTFAKGARASAMIGGTRVELVGIIKGSGMIAPDMATMLGFVFTDAAVAPELLQAMLDAANIQSFSSITVDGDTSTSDTVLAFATGRAGNPTLESMDDTGADAFQAALADICLQLAHLVVRDGEGASKFVRIDVEGAESDASAHRVALSIANSPLVKTAIAGEDANWGRVVMAVGKAGEPAERDRLAIRFGATQVARDGVAVEGYDEAPVAAHLKGQEVEIGVDLGLGDGRATVWTCDLTHGYISINADYRS
jgi:glutamate N-acetyltransferase/amino-acid N-acetyltransferase